MCVFLTLSDLYELKYFDEVVKWIIKKLVSVPGKVYNYVLSTYTLT